MAYTFLIFTAVLITMIAFNMGNFYVFDIPQALAQPFIRYFNITTVEISLLYTVYSLPNFIFTPLGSVILSYTGLGYGAMLFTGFISFGLVFINIGVMQKYFPFVVLGRTLFGIGGENAIIAQASIAEKWFSGKFLSLALGLNNMISLLANTFGNYFTPYLFEKERSFGFTLFMNGVLTVIAWCFAVVYYLIETKYNHLAEGEGEENKEEDEEENNMDHVVVRFGFSHINELPPLFWYVTLAFTFISNSYYNFIDFGTDCIQNKFAYSYGEAKNFISIITLGVVITLPIISAMVVRVGMKGYFLLAASVLATLSYTYMAFLPNEKNPGVLISVLGISLFFSIYNAAIWSSIALSVPKQAVSFAYAASTTVQNIGLTCFPLFFGWLNTERTPYAYKRSLLGLAILGVISILVSILIIIDDVRTGGVLNLPENSKEVKELRSRATENFRASYLLSMGSSQNGSDKGSSQIMNKLSRKRGGTLNKGLMEKNNEMSEGNTGNNIPTED